MALPIAGAGAAMIPGFFGGLGYGTGLQYSYARGFPAFEAGGAKGYVDTVSRDALQMLMAFAEAGDIINVDPVKGQKNISGQTYQDWKEGYDTPKPSQKVSPGGRVSPSKYHPTVQKFQQQVKSGSVKARSTNRHSFEIPHSHRWPKNPYAVARESDAKKEGLKKFYAKHGKTARVTKISATNLRNLKWRIDVDYY